MTSSSSRLMFLAENTTRLPSSGFRRGDVFEILALRLEEVGSSRFSSCIIVPCYITIILNPIYPSSFNSLIIYTALNIMPFQQKILAKVVFQLSQCLVELLDDIMHGCVWPGKPFILFYKRNNSSASCILYWSVRTRQYCWEHLSSMAQLDLYCIWNYWRYVISGNAQLAMVTECVIQHDTLSYLSENQWVGRLYMHDAHI